MIKNRILYLILLIGSLIYFIFANDSISFAILLILLIFPILGIIIAYFESRKCIFDIKLKEKVFIGEENDLVIKTNTIFPCKVKVELISNNKLTKISESISYDLLLGFKNEYKIKNCNKDIGLIEYDLENTYFYDVFGLLKFKWKNENDTSCFCLPNYREKKINLDSKLVLNDNDDSLKAFNKMESNDYSQYRKYVPGDSLKSINWKLSTKLNDLYVKISEKSVNKSLLIVFSNEFEKETNENITLYFSLIKELLSKKFDVDAAYIINELKIKKIVKEEDINSLLFEMLENNIASIKEKDLYQVKTQYSLVIVITRQIIDDIFSLNNEEYERSKQL